MPWVAKKLGSVEFLLFSKIKGYFWKDQRGISFGYRRWRKEGAEEEVDTVRPVLESCIFEPVADGVPNVCECLRCRVIKFPRPCERVALPTWRSMGAFYWSGSKVSFYVFNTTLTSTQKAESTYHHSWRAFCPSLTIFSFSVLKSYGQVSRSFLERGKKCY